MGCEESTVDGRPLYLLAGRSSVQRSLSRGEIAVHRWILRYLPTVMSANDAATSAKAAAVSVETCGLAVISCSDGAVMEDSDRLSIPLASKNNEGGSGVTVGTGLP